MKRLRDVCETREAASVHEKDALRTQLSQLQRLMATKDGVATQEKAALAVRLGFPKLSKPRLWRSRAVQGLAFVGWPRATIWVLVCCSGVSFCALSVHVLLVLRCSFRELWFFALLVSD